MNRIGILVILILLVVGCKKPHERQCYKSHGDTDSLIHAIENISYFDLGKRIRYRIFQDSLNQVIVHGGENIISFIELEKEADTLRIRNKNRCNFLRNKEEHVFVDIHYPEYNKIRCDITDTLQFMDTIEATKLDIKLVEGGGYMELDVDVNQFRLDVTDGVTNFKVGGNVTGTSEIFVKVLSFGDARNLNSKNYLITNNSTGDFYVNLDNAYTVAKVWGTGNIWYTGVPDTLIVDQVGDGDIVPL